MCGDEGGLFVVCKGLGYVAVSIGLSMDEEYGVGCLVEGISAGQ